MVGTTAARLVAVALLSGAIMTPQAARAQKAPHESSEILVTAVRSKLSNWRQAETNHVIMLSDRPEAELVKFTRNLERLHFLLSGLMGRGVVDDDVVKIRITLIGDVAQFDEMNLRNKRWQQGPYNDLFQVGRYYDPRQDGAVMASVGADQRVVVERTPINVHSVAGVLSSMALATGPGATLKGDSNLQQEVFAAIGSMELSASAGLKGRHDDGITFGEKNLTITEDSLLYAGYAQHFLLTYFPAAYPRWYLDGFAQIFATMAVKSDNVLEFGRTPDGAAAVMHGFGPYPIKDVLDDTYLTQDPHKTRWTPIHAWMLTHFLFFDDKRRPQLRQYLAMRAQGVDAATAAEVFGDQKQLGHEIGAYFYNRKPYLQITYDGSKIEQPIVRRLRESEASFIKGRLELGARVEIPPAPGADASPDLARELVRMRDKALRERDNWLEGLRRAAARWSGEVEAQLLLAEAECRSGNANECLTAARRAETIAPNDTRAMVWKAFAMLHSAVAAPPAERAPIIASARDLIMRANRLDHDAIEPLMAYYASFVASGEVPSATAVDGLQRAMEEVPAAPETRVTLADALIKRGQYAVAKPVILPVAAGPYDSPEKPAAKSLLARIDASTSAHASASGPSPLQQTSQRAASSAPAQGPNPSIQ